MSPLDGDMLVCQSSSLLWIWSELVGGLLIFANEAGRWEALGAIKADTLAEELPVANELTMHNALNFMLLKGY